MLAASVRLGRDDGRMNSGRMSPGLLAQQRYGIMEKEGLQGEKN